MKKEEQQIRADERGLVLERGKKLIKELGLPKEYLKILSLMVVFVPPSEVATTKKDIKTTNKL